MLREWTYTASSRDALGNTSLLSAVYVYNTSLVLVKHGYNELLPNIDNLTVEWLTSLRARCILFAPCFLHNLSSWAYPDASWSWMKKEKPEKFQREVWLKIGAFGILAVSSSAYSKSKEGALKSLHLCPYLIIQSSSSSTISIHTMKT